MNYAVVLYFDESSSKKIDAIKRFLKINGVTVEEVVNPHISLALYSEVDERKLIEKVKGFAERKMEMSLMLSHIGVFPTEEGVLFFAPKVTPELLAVHADFIDYMDEFKDQLAGYYGIDFWTPHITLGMHLPEGELLDAVRLLKNKSVPPIVVSFQKIAVWEVSPSRQIFETEFNAT